MTHAKSLLAYRIAAWSLASVAGIVAGMSIPGATASEGAISGGLIAILLGLGSEVVALWLAVRSFRAPAPRWTDPADGRVEWAAVAGARGEPDPVDPRRRRFAGFDAAPGRRAPSAAPAGLLGRVVVASLFVGRDGSSWGDREVAGAHRSLIRAGEWIEREAIRWGAAVNVAVVEVDFVADDPIDEEVTISVVDEGAHSSMFQADASTRALASASRAASAIGVRDFATLADEMAARVEADSVVWLIHLRRAGRSHVVETAEAPTLDLRVAVCYAREAGFPEPLTGPPYPDPITFVHEMLHLFGARDKYGRSLGDFPPKSVTSRDVMRLDVESLARLRVDPLTASEIGWAGRPRP